MPAPSHKALLLLCCLMAVPAAALAQDATVKQDLAIPDTKKVEDRVGDWSVACTEKAGEQRRCKMAQQAADAKTRKPILTWLIGRDGKGAPAMSFQTPTGLLLPAGVRLAIDNKPPVVVPFRTCVAQVCEAVVPLTGELASAMRTGSRAAVTFTSLEGKPVTLNMSLKGFAGAYDIYRGKQ